MAERISLKRYWEAIEARLTSSTIDDLRSIIRGLAREVRPSNRLDFLRKISSEPGFNESMLQGISEADLITEIDELVHEIRIEMSAADAWDEYDDYHGEWGNYYSEEDDLGPYDQFIEHVEALFDKVQAAFDMGDYSLARKAYQKLFDDLLVLEDDYGRGIRFEHLEIDPIETRGRYLRSVYETEALAQRPDAIFNHLYQTQSLFYTHTPPMFDDLIQVSPKPLPDRESFFKAWITFLKNFEDSAADAWLREATRMFEDTPGLEKLAQARGPAYPRTYLDWITALKIEEKHREAISAAQEALADLPERLPIRAAIADLMCDSASALGEDDSLSAIRWIAFRAKPNLDRLLDLWEASEPKERIHVAGCAANYLQTYLENPPDGSAISRDWENDGLERPASTDLSVLAHAFLLAHGFDRTYELATQAQVLGWSRSNNVQSIVVPYFLVMLSEKTQSELPPNLAELWQLALTNSYYSYESDFSGRNERLEQAYEVSLNQASMAPDRQLEILTWCLTISHQRASAIVSNQYRKSYHKAAKITVSCAEVLKLRGLSNEANKFVDDIRDRFPRHSAFQRELKYALQRR